MAMRSPGDSKKAESYMHLLEGVNTDILHYNDIDADGNIGLSGVILPKTAFPEGENITNKRAPFFTLQYDFNEEVYRNTKFRQNSNHTLTGQIFHHQCAS